MHDSLGHELSLLALRAAALQVAPDLAADHRAAAADLRVAAADATDHLHRIIGVLREVSVDDEPAPLAPAGESVEDLVARAAESGLPVRWEPRDDTTAPAPDPGGIAERLLHRVVREAPDQRGPARAGRPRRRSGHRAGPRHYGHRHQRTGRPGGVPFVGRFGPARAARGRRLGRRRLPTRARTGTASGSGRTSPPNGPPPRPRPPPLGALHPRPPPRRRRPGRRRRCGRRPGRRRLRLVRVHRDALGAQPRRVRGTAPGHAVRRGRPLYCRTARSTTRPSNAPPRPRRTPTAVTTGRAVNSSSPSTTSGSASTRRGAWLPRTSSPAPDRPARDASPTSDTRSPHGDPGTAGRRRGDGAGRRARHPGERRGRARSSPRRGTAARRSNWPVPTDPPSPCWTSACPAWTDSRPRGRSYGPSPARPSPC